MSLINSRTWRRRSIACRRGVTVAEVLFATGIAVAGMLGIASLLLIAGRNASQSNRSVETQALADKWYNELLTRDMNNPGNWIWYQDYSFAIPGTTVPPGLKQFGKLQYSAVPAGRSTHSTGSLDGVSIRPAGKQSVCIDPWFYSERNLRSQMPIYNSGSNSSWYRPAVFPYYQDGFNPLTDSAYANATTTGLAWRDQPRMIRATFGTPADPTVPDVTLNNAIGEKFLASMFTSNNEMSLLVDDDDKTVAPQRGFFQMPNAAGTAMVPAQAAYNPSYSWMATLSPLEEQNSTSEDYYTLSLMVIHQRDRQMFVPTERVAGDLPNPEAKPAGERTTWIFPLSGNFTGGSGGRVRIIGSTGVSDSVNVGDWIMLSRNVRGTWGGGHPIQNYSVFRWYRVIGADLESKIGSASPAYGSSDPFGNLIESEELWSRDVILDGPDWQFFDEVSGSTGQIYPVLSTTATSAFPAPTTGTLISGLIAVHERVIRVPSALDF